MKLWLTLFIELILFIVSPNLILAQSSYAQFDNFTEKDHFPDSYITVVLQDKKGFIWFGSNEGLSRYDGITFKVYSHKNDDLHSLASDNINAIVQDPNGVIWIGTKNGLSRYDEIHDDFQNFFHRENDPSSLSDDNAWSLAVDQNGNLWIGTVNGGLNEMIQEKDLHQKEAFHFISFQNDSADQNSLSDNYVLSLFFDQFGHGWVGTKKGLNRFSTDDAKDQKILFTHFRADYSDIHGMSYDWVWNITGDKSGNIWLVNYYRLDVITSSQAKSNSGNIRFIRALSVLNTQSGEINKIVYAALVDRDNNLWIGTEKNGVTKAHIQLDSINLTIAFDDVEHFVRDERNPQSLVCNVVYAFMEDIAGMIWIGTEQGISKYIPGREEFNTLHLNENDSLLRTDVTAMAIDHQNNVWIGGNTNGISCLTENKCCFIKLPAEKQLSNYNDLNIIVSICRSSIGDLYVGTNRGLYVAAGSEVSRFLSGSVSDLQFQWFNVFKTSTDEPQLEFIVENSKGEVWLEGRNAIMKFNFRDTSRNVIIPFYDPDNPKEPLMLRTIFADTNNELWIGSDNGLLQASADGKLLNVFKHASNNPRSISNDQVNCIFRDSQGILWIGTANGIDEFNEHTKEFITPYKHNNFPTTNIQSITDDTSKRLWISTRTGLTCLDLNSNTSRNFNEQDGLNSDYMNQNASCKMNNGIMLFGSKRGVNSFNPNAIGKNTIPPSIVISDFSILGKSIFNANDTSRIILFRSKNNITLCPDENQFTISFAALNYLNPAKNQYKYQLVGFDKDWVDAGNNHNATYTNLGSGDYTFNIRAANKDGVWNTKGISIAVTVIPPYYETWWFRTLILIALAALIYSFYRYRLSQIYKLQSMRNKIADDLHDDIGSTLNSISVYSAVAKNKSKHDLPELDLIGEASRKVIEAMSDIVWTINPDNDQLEQVILRMRSVSYSLLRAKNIEFTFHADEALNELKLSIGNRRNFYLIFKEALNNLVKYSQAKKVSISLLKEERFIRLRVRDNGIGFDVNNPAQGNGINSMKRRAKEMTAVLHVESEINSGTTIELILKA